MRLLHHEGASVTISRFRNKSGVAKDTAYDFYKPQRRMSFSESIKLSWQITQIRARYKERLLMLIC